MAHGIQAYIKSQVAEGFKGYACDVGANNGEFESNTIELEKSGWVVLCVEPNPHLVAAANTRMLWRQVAAGSKNEIRTFMSIGGAPYQSGSRIDAPEGEKLEVQVLTLDTILEQAGFPRLDFLTVDTEGWEEEVMKGFTVERWKPKFISLEHYDHKGFDNFKTGNVQNPLPIPGYSALGPYQFDVLYLRQIP
jgi:FkbM family methyltransferase